MSINKGVGREDLIRIYNGTFSSVQSLSCPTLCDPMNRSTPGLPVYHQLPESTQTHVHRVCDAIKPSHLLSSPSPLALNLSQHQGLFKWVSSSHQVAKVLESSFSISPSNEHSGLISITSNLPWFMNVTFQVPIQYCSSQRPSLLPSPITSTAGRSFLFGSVSSFFLELFLHSSPVACWAPTDLGRSSFNVCLFAFLYCSWGSQGKNTEVVCHSLLQWTMFFLNSPLWPIHPGWSYMAWLIVSMSLLLIVASQPAYRFLRGH